MFLQETKTKRGGKTYVSYLVRESFRTPSGPRGRTICNVTHLPKAVRDLVGTALKGKAFVPVDKIRLQNIHSFGGCAVLEDAGRRYELPSLLHPLTPRNRSLIQAMIFGGLLFPPSIAPFYLESRSSRLAMFCGLDPDQERFDLADLNAALLELDAHWDRISHELLEASREKIRAFVFFRKAGKNRGEGDFGILALDADGVPMPFSMTGGDGKAVELETFLNCADQGSAGGPPLLVMDEETAAGVASTHLSAHACLIEVPPKSAASLWHHLSAGGAPHREVGPVEMRQQDRRYIFLPAAGDLCGEDFAPAGDVSLAHLGKAASAGTIDEAGNIRAILTTGRAEAVPPAAVVEWADRACQIRKAFSPIHLVIGSSAEGEGISTWRNHHHLQFLTHRLRCQLHAEWQARGEHRPVEEVLRDLQDIYRGTLAVDGVEVSGLPPQIPQKAAELLDKLNLWPLFHSNSGGCGE